MGDVHVYLENGFDHDLVTISAGDEQSTAPEVTTRYQIGLASVVEVAVPTGAPAVLRIELPERGLAVDATVDPIATPHVRVSLTDGSLEVHAQAAPPMFA